MKSKRHIVVTGALGQLGKSLRDILEKRSDISFQGIDRDDVDLTSEAATREFFAMHSCDVVINCAAYTAVDKAETEREKAAAVNISAVGHIASCAKELGFRIIHVSTDYVFPGDADIPYKEADQTGPTTYYGESKLKGEQLLQSIVPEAVVVRTAWLYSGYGKNFFLTMREKALNGECVRVVADQTGSPTLATDLAQALVTVATVPEWAPGIYHFTNEGTTTWYEFTREIYAALGADTNLVTPIRSDEFNCLAKRPHYSVLDKEKIKTTFGLEIPNWKDSLKQLINNGIE